MVWKSVSAKSAKVFGVVTIMSLMLASLVAAQDGYTQVYDTTDVKEGITDVLVGTAVGVADVADLIGSSVGFLVVVTVIGALLGALFVVFRRARLTRR